MTKRKRIVTILLSAAGICAAGSGVVYAVKSTQKSEVLVVPVSEVNNGGYWDDAAQNMDGMVTSDTTQNVYLTDTQTVEEVKVKEGDIVKEGDVLLTYDMELSSLNLEMQKLSRDQAEIHVKIAENDLKKLKKIKSASNNPAASVPVGSDSIDVGGDDEGDNDSDPETEQTPSPTETPTEIPTETPTPSAPTVFSKDNPLSYSNRQQYYDGEGDKDKPYRFLCENGTVIEASFMNAMMGYVYDENGVRGEKAGKTFFFVLEVREGDKKEGNLIKGWKQNGASIEKPFDEDWRGELELKSNSDSFIETSAGNMKIQPLNLAMRGKKKFIFTDTRGASASPNSQNRKESPKPSMTPSVVSSDTVYTKDELASAIMDKEKELSALRLDLQEQNMKLNTAQKTLDEGQVTAKFGGVVKNVGDPKNPPRDGSPFLVVSGTEGLYVCGLVSELMLDKIKEGNVVSVTSYESGTTCEATVKEVSPYPSEQYNNYSDSNASGYPLTLLIKEGGEQFRNNEGVGISLDSQSDGNMGGGLSLSRAFIKEENGAKYVYVRGKDKRLKRKKINTGRLIWGDCYEIKDGVGEEDWIAFPYAKNVREGAKTKEGSSEQLYR